jgi:lysophospholipase L1-like esterase
MRLATAIPILTIVAVALFSSGLAHSAKKPRDASKFEAEIRAFEDKDRATPPQPGGIVFVGSSSIKGWRSLEKDFPGLGTVNRGFGGSVIPDATHFAGRIVTKYRPRQVVFYSGDNDLAAGQTPREVLLNFDAFVKRVRRDLPEVPIAFISIKPSPSRARILPAVMEANHRIRTYAYLNPFITYIDIAAPMMQTDGTPRKDLFVSDMLHLNAEGYKLWAEHVRPHLVPPVRVGANKRPTKIARRF